MPCALRSACSAHARSRLPRSSSRGEWRFSVPLFDGQHRLLQPCLPGPVGLFFFALFLLRVRLREEVHLLKLWLCPGGPLVRDMICRDVHAPDQQLLIDNAVIKPHGGLHDALCGGGHLPDVLRAVRHLRHPPPVPVRLDFSAVICGQTLNVIADREHDLIRHKPLVHQIQHQAVGHLPDDHAGLVEGIGLLQDLPDADAVVLRPEGLDVPDLTGLPAPGVVDQQLRVHTKEPV